MGKAKRGRVLKENEAQAVLHMVRTSPRKLNLVAQLIRGKKVAAARAAPAAAGIRSPRGASRPRARKPAATSRRRNTSCARGTPARAVASPGNRRKTCRAQFGKARSSMATF